MEETHCDLSIIVPYHNEEFELVQKALDSVTTQKTNISYEVILVDDGSDREKTDKVRQYAERIPNVRFFSQESKGVSAARNRGIQQARGEYIVFFVFFDRLTSQFFADMDRVLPMKPDLAIGGSRATDVDEKPQCLSEGELSSFYGQKAIHVWKPRLYGKAYYFSKENNVILNRGIAGKVVRAEIAKQIQLKEDLHLSEDITFFLQVIDSSSSVVVVKQLWYLYTKNVNSVTRRYSPQIIERSHDSLTSIKERLNLQDAVEAKAYADRIIRELIYISDNFLDHPDNDLGLIKRWSLLKKVYNEEPWVFLKHYSYKGHNERRVILLYRVKLLFLWWSMKKKLKRKTHHIV